MTIEKIKISIALEAERKKKLPKHGKELPWQNKEQMLFSFYFGQMMIRAKKWKPEIIEPPEAVAVWMIILAIGGGLLLLVIIGLVLWKVLSLTIKRLTKILIVLLSLFGC